ncbi:hypothetical protein [Metabacillus fastidiosus]|uniref:KTSC domain-containing protein n=1 Tax=Metabacillus fastidiosus TaxID=1458 RepID=A0ABU6P2Y6_9BACI|nr:hypothetical protein [Metabacillus fastidiosus]
MTWITDDNEFVKLDFINTITHYQCVSLPANLIKDFGTLEQIKMKYPIFNKEYVN